MTPTDYIVFTLQIMNATLNITDEEIEEYRHECSTQIDDLEPIQEIEIGDDDKTVDLNDWRNYEEDLPDDDVCDCCLGSWTSEPNEYGVCDCWCSHCDEYLRDCQYNCLNEE